MKLRCSATIIAALLTAVSVFIANIGHTEYKSQIRKRKMRKTSQTITTTNNALDISEKDTKNVQLI